MRDEAANIRSGTATPLPTAKSPLFREEILALQSGPKLGTVLLDPRPSWRVAAIGAGICAVGLILLLIFGAYTRKETLRGWLIPQGGIVAVLPPQAGVVKGLHVSEGMSVEKGQPLLTIATDLETKKFGSTSDAVIRQLEGQRAALVAQRESTLAMTDEQIRAAEQRLRDGRDEFGALASEIDLQKSRIGIASGALSRARQLRSEAIISLTTLGRYEAELIDERSRLAALERQRLQLRRDIVDLSATLEQLPQQRAMKAGESDEKIAAIDQQMAEAEARREIVLQATQKGTVTAIQTGLGAAVGPDSPTMTIVPAGEDLRAELFATSRAVGFIKVGTKVLLRYHSYPYQNFGYYRGEVLSVSKTSTSTSELPKNLAGLSEFYGTNVPVFRVNVKLERQSVDAYGKQVPLQAGMQVDADILIERHSLMAWLFYPILSRTGAWVQ